MGDMTDFSLSSIDELYGDGGMLSCCYCGVGDLRWGKNHLGGWRLCDFSGVQHSCKEYLYLREQNQ